LNSRLNHTFYQRDALTIAPEILGKTLVRAWPDGTRICLPISEVEVYLGTHDRACNASKGKTERNQIMFANGGVIYMYLVYGMHWMFNIVTGTVDQPEALLIRGIGNIYGPGRVTRHLQLDKHFYGEDLATSEMIWLEEAPPVKRYSTGPRVGINYAGEPWVSMPWRYKI